MSGGRGPAMRFAIRDDDVCYHTDPNALRALYEKLSERCPISFGCIPWVGGFEVDAFPPEKWAQLDDAWIPWQTRESYPLDGNQALVNLLAEWCRTGRATVLLHGLHHDLYELAQDRPFEADIAAARRFLEELVGQPVCVASAPNNSLGPAATRALERSGFDVLVAFGHLPRERPAGVRSYWGFLRLLALYARHRRRLRLTRPLYFGGHQEQPCYDLGPNSNVDEIFRGVEHAARAGGNFVVATHYYHLAVQPELHRTLLELVAHAERVTGGEVHFVAAEALFQQ